MRYSIDIELTRLFVKVIQHGGFSKAADALKVPKSTVSKGVTRLEQQTGTKLLLRTTRSQTLTAAGRIFYETCLGPIQTLEDAQKSLYGQDNIVSGRIKLTAPEDIGSHVVAPSIGRLCLKYPNLEFELHYTNEIVDLVKEGYDFAIRLGDLPASSLKQRKIGELQMVAVASPLYLKTAGKIRTPADLEKLNCLVISGSAASTHWLLKKDKKQLRARVRAQVQSNQVSSLLKIAQSGAGVALLPKFLCKSELESGKLVQVLPDWSGRKIDVSLVSPTSTLSSSRLNLVTAEIVTAVKAALGSE